jgi:predicted ATP-dependent serine protease
MAHYDCSNCGERMGVAFGSCSSCTPPQYDATNRELRDIANKAAEEWAVKDEKRSIKQAEKRRKWIEKREKKLGAEKLRNQLHDIRMKHDGSYRYMYEHEQRKKEQAT